MNHTHNTPARKGIILAGGSGTRLYSLTQAVSKQLSLSTLTADNGISCSYLVYIELGK